MDLDLIAQLLILLSVSMLLGVILSRFRIPDVVAYIASGVILGNVALKIIKPNIGISDIESVSLFFIILGIGIESNTEYIYGKLKKSVILSTTSFILPLLFSYFVLHYIESYPVVPSLVISLSVSVPSISIVSVLLMKYNFLDRKGGQIILSSVVLTDMIAFVLLSSVSSSLVRVFLVILAIALFFVAIYIFDKIIRKNAGRIINWLNKNENTSSAEYILFSLVIIAGLLVSELFEIIGITYVLGAFFAGILVHEASVGQKFDRAISNTTKRINDSFFIPLFFSIAGLSVVRLNANSAGILAPLLVSSLVVASGLTFYVSSHVIKDMNKKDILSIMGGRGAVGVVIATIAYQTSLISVEFYSIAILATVIISIVMTPILGIGKKVIINGRRKIFCSALTRNQQIQISG